MKEEEKRTWKLIASVLALFIVVVITYVMSSVFSRVSYEGKIPTQLSFTVEVVR